MTLTPHSDATTAILASDRLLTPADVARYCHISSKTVLRAIRAGRLRASRLGARGVYRFRIEDVHEWIAATAVRAERAPEPDAAALRADELVVRSRRGGSLPGAGRLAVTDEMGRQR